MHSVIYLTNYSYYLGKSNYAETEEHLLSLVDGENLKNTVFSRLRNLVIQKRPLSMQRVPESGTAFKSLYDNKIYLELADSVCCFCIP